MVHISCVRDHASLAISNFCCMRVSHARIMLGGVHSRSTGGSCIVNLQADTIEFSKQGSFITDHFPTHASWWIFFGIHRPMLRLYCRCTSRMLCKMYNIDLSSVDQSVVYDNCWWIHLPFWKRGTQSFGFYPLEHWLTTRLIALHSLTLFKKRAEQLCRSPVHNFSRCKMTKQVLAYGNCSPAQGLHTICIKITTIHYDCLNHRWLANRLLGPMICLELRLQEEIPVGGGTQLIHTWGQCSCIQSEEPSCVGQQYLQCLREGKEIPTRRGTRRAPCLARSISPSRSKKGSLSRVLGREQGHDQDHGQSPGNRVVVRKCRWGRVREGTANAKALGHL